LPMIARVHLLLAAALAAALLLGDIVRADDRNVLWKIVQACVVAQTRTSDPAPCAYVNVSAGEQDGHAVLKDLRGKTQFLLIPTRRIAGIESPEILGAAPNYWQAAWDARRYIDLVLGRELPRTAIGLAINAPEARSQDHLHIHVDCIQPSVVDQITKHIDQIGEDWTAPFDLMGRRFKARRLYSSNLEGKNPFELLASSGESTHPDISHAALAVLGASFGDRGDGFILLAEEANPAVANSGEAEDLLDHSCALAASPS
jgi:CDP-diacylglycerol pyrophosphatase